MAKRTLQCRCITYARRDRRTPNKTFTKTIHVIFLFLAFFTPALASSPADNVHKPQWPTGAIEREAKVKELIHLIGESIGSSEKDKKITYEIIKCENRQLDPEKQSDFITKEGEKEPSFGLAQIHTPSNPGISPSEYSDPVFSIRFILQNLKEGRGYLWTCYRNMLH